MSSVDDELVSGEEPASRTFEELAHFLYSDKHKALHTEMKSPDAMSTLDAATLGLLKAEFQGTGLYEDVRSWVDWKRRNWIAFGRQRAKETEAIASAAAQREQERSAFREKLLGSLER